MKKTIKKLNSNLFYKIKSACRVGVFYFQKEFAGRYIMYKSKLALITLCSAASIGNSYSMREYTYQDFVHDADLLSNLDSTPKPVSAIQEQMNKHKDALYKEINRLNDQIIKTPDSDINKAAMMNIFERLVQQITNIEAQERQSAHWCTP